VGQYVFTLEMTLLVLVYNNTTTTMPGHSLHRDVIK